MAEDTQHNAGGSEAEEIQKKLDADFADARKKTLGFVEGDENKREDSQSEGEKPEEKPKEKKEEEEKSESDNEGEKKPQDEDDEEKSKSDDEAEENDDDEEDDEDSDDEESDDEKPKSSEARPERYIPVKHHKDEVRKWKDKVKELEAIVSSSSEGSKSKSDKYKAYAEKHGLDIENVKELADIIKEDSKEHLLREVLGDADISSIRDAAEIAKATKEVAHFENEWKAFSPEIKKLYPDATQEQLETAKAKLDEIAHSKWGHDKDLDYIAYKKREEFDTIFKAPQKGTRTAENSRAGASRPSPVSARDFSISNKERKPFSELEKLSKEEQSRIASDMDPMTYFEWAQHLETSGSDMTVRRNGEIVKLK